MYGPYNVEVHPFYTQFVENFYHEGMLNFVKRFPAPFEMTLIFISPSISVHTGINPGWS